MLSGAELSFCPGGRLRHTRFDLARTHRAAAARRIANLAPVHFLRVVVVGTRAVQPARHFDGCRAHAARHLSRPLPAKTPRCRGPRQRCAVRQRRAQQCTNQAAESAYLNGFRQRKSALRCLCPTDPRATYYSFVRRRRSPTRSCSKSLALAACSTAFARPPHSALERPRHPSSSSFDPLASLASSLGAYATAAAYTPPICWPCVKPEPSFVTPVYPVGEFLLRSPWRARAGDAVSCFVVSSWCPSVLRRGCCRPCSTRVLRSPCARACRRCCLRRRRRRRRWSRKSRRKCRRRRCCSACGAKASRSTR